MKDKRNFFAGVFIGIVIVILFNSALNGVDAAYVRVGSKQLDMKQKVDEIYSILDSYYVEKFDRKELEESMYGGLVSGIGDPYTTYMDKNTLDKFMLQTEGTYAGIGVVVTTDPRDNTVLVISPYEDYPGAKAGILPGDKFIKINGSDILGNNLDEAVSLIKGKPGTSVKITVFRESERRTFDVDVVREQINIPTVSHKMLENDIGYLRITSFERVTTDQFKEAYADLNKKKMKGLVLDLRNNPGGLLDVVTTITDMLVPKGYILYTEDKNGKKQYTYSNDLRINIPLAILVNGNSASASEVLSGAVKDMNVGVLVGEKTFGKGLVQNLYPISDGSALKVTIAKYYTPSGVCINGEGITPDYVVEMSNELTVKISSLTMDEDVQLQKAVSVIKDKIK